MAEPYRFELSKDQKGVMWDLILYVPTFIFLMAYASKLWFSGNSSFTYVLLFASTLIFLIAFNRIFKTRLMMLPSSPTALNVSKKGVTLELKNQDTIDLVKDIRFFADFAGKSIGISGNDLTGKIQKFVFHKGQFAKDSDFDELKSRLRVFK
ncbi:MAG: hypothetical protein OEZ43_02105 [Gammaproteobacteria bacterium]|nr:hypothetical protein [Gammaproteobacteria bacterium]